MQPININQLIQQDNLREIGQNSAAKTMPKLSFSAKELLNEGEKGVIVSTYNRPSATAWGAISITSTDLQFLEYKDGKTRVFKFNVEKSFLSINNRKADLDTVSLLRDRLRRFLMATKQSPPMWALGAISNAGTTPAAEWIEAIEKSGIYTEAANLLEIKIDSGRQAKVLRSVFHFSNLLIPAQVESAETNSPPDYAVKIKKLLQAVRSKFAEVLIENRSDKKAAAQATQSVYKLMISEPGASFEEKSTFAKNRVEFNFEQDICTLNQEEMKLTSYKWFLEKLKKVGSDLSSQRAVMFKKV